MLDQISVDNFSVKSYDRPLETIANPEILPLILLKEDRG